MTHSIDNQRLDYLDAVRAFALLLGIVFHASLSFLPMYIGWAVMDVSTSNLIGGFIVLSHSFRMPLFFLIAGFFSHRVFHGKGGGTFLKSRLVRIGIPFVVGWFLLRPLLVSGWVMGGASMRGEVDILAGLKAGFISLFAQPRELFTGSHLWFLYYLMLITALVLIGRSLLLPLPRIRKVLGGAVDRACTWMSHRSCPVYLLTLPTALCLWKMSNWGMDTPDKSLIPHIPVLLVYGGFFFLGWLLDRKPENIARIARLSVGHLVLCLVAAGACLYLSRFQSDLGHPYLNALRAGYVVSYAFMMWSLVVLTLGLFKRFLDKPSKVVRYIADSSYWLYLVHLPIVLWLQIAFAELGLHWSIKWFSISVITIGVSLVMYELFVRSTLIGKVLNGRRRPRALLVRRTSKGPLKTELQMGKVS